MKLNLFIMLLFVSSLSFAQKTVTGKIVDATNNEPLVGASIQVKGTFKGTITGIDGDFSLEVSEKSSLIISLVGYDGKEVAVGSNEQLNIQLSPGQGLLQEVVVAYNRIQKEGFTGSAAQVSLTALERAPRASVQESLQGNVAGVQVSNGSGQPGSIPSIRIRGIGSINASSAPLYVVDGIPVYSGDASGYNNNAIAGISSADIESVTILKDASAASLYGSRAANGVVLITTKAGKAGKVKISASGQYGINQLTLTDQERPLNTTEMLELMREGWVNSGRADTAFNSELGRRGVDPNVNTDWLNALLRQGNFSQYDLSFGGGSEKLRYYLSGGMFNSTAPLKGVGYNRMTTKLNVISEANKWLKLNGSLGVSYQKSNTVTDAGAFSNPIRSVYRLQPWLNIYRPDGTYDLSYNSTYNPVALNDLNTRIGRTYNLLGSFGGTITLTDNLSFDSKASLDWTLGKANLYWNPNFGDGRNSNGRASATSAEILNYVSTNILRYKNVFADVHGLEAFAGYEVQKFQVETIDASATNLLPDLTTLANASQTDIANSTETQNSILGAFFNTTYNYDGKYYLTGSIRRDGSSRFGRDTRFGTFYSVGAAWNIHREKFLKDNKLISNLKLRASYGTNGNQPNNNFDALGQYGSGFDYNGLPGHVLSQYSNPNFTWEINTPLNVGLEVGLLNNRVSGVFEYYNRVTSSLILNVPISSTNGLTSYSDNVGEMRNTGYEFTLETQNIKSDNGGFEWNTSFNISTTKNEVTKLPAPINDGVFRREVGRDYYSYYMQGYAGVSPDNGTALWYKDSTQTEKVNAFGSAGRYYQGGSALPKFFGGMTNTLTYKGLGLSFQLFFNWGNKVYDSWAAFTHSDGSGGFSATNKIAREVYNNRWRKAGDVTETPKLVYLGTQTGLSNMISSRFLYDGSYVRLRDITLSYKLPKTVTERMKMGTVNAYVRANNLWTWKKDKQLNFDPETPVTGIFDQRPPVFYTFIGGIDVSF